MIVVFGSINVDFVFALDHLPIAGETVLGPGVQIQPGGKGANQALAAARDGADVVMVGAVGRDALAEAGLALLREGGVDLSRVAVGAAATGCAAICTDTSGRNQIAVGSGANLIALADQIEPALLGPHTTLLLQMEVDMAETVSVIRRGRAAGARIVLNLAPAAAIDAAALAAVDVLVVNEHEAEFLAGDLGIPADRLHERFDLTVVRTLGERGVAYAGPAGKGCIDALAIDVVDTTTAGDCFTGVLAASLDRGLGLEAALHRANTAAGLCCGAQGSQRSLPRREAIDAALRRGS